MTSKVSLKWSKNQYDIDLASIPDVKSLREYIHKITNVPVERQKIMFKGKLIKDDFTLSSVPSAAQLTLIGSASEAIATTTEKVIFKDIGDHGDISGGIPAPAGLANLGNTCYANSVIQMLLSSSDLVESLEKFLVKFDSFPLTSNNAKLTLALARLSRRLHSTNVTKETSIIPAEFIMALRAAVPQFNEMNSNFGVHEQQDADECLNAILNAISEVIENTDGSRITSDNSSSTFTRQKKNIIDSLFSFETEVQTKLDPAEIKQEHDKIMNEYEELQAAEEKRKAEALKNNETYHEIAICPPHLPKQEDVDMPNQYETSRKLTVTITETTNYMEDGFVNSMNDSIERQCTLLHRKANYLREHRLLDLPKFLIVRFNRFYWRQDTKKNAKVLRKVIFPLEYDAYALTGGSLRQALGKKREELHEIRISSLTTTNKPTTTPRTPAVTSTTPQNNIDNPTSAAEAKYDTKMDDNDNLTNDTNNGPRKSMKNALTSSGRYALVSIVTHKGRGANAGHYIGWRRHAPIFTQIHDSKLKNSNTDPKQIWHKFDDTVVTETTAEEIEKLCGGGDLDTAYILMYARIDDLQ